MNGLCKITYISNAGVMLEFGQKKAVIDGFCRSIMPIYKNLPESIKEQMMAGVPPFDHIDLLLFTHDHSDHFDPESTGEFLRSDPNAVLIGGQEVLGKIPGLFDWGKGRWIEAGPAPGRTAEVEVHGLKIRLIPLLHEGKEYRDVQNMAYLIEAEGKKVLHVGDAKPAPENYLNLDLTEKNIDLLVAPFPYVGLSSARRVVEKYIKPKKIVAVHFPHRELDRDRWIDATEKSYLRVKKDFIETIFLQNIGESINI